MLPFITSEIRIEGNGFTLNPSFMPFRHHKRILRVPVGGNLTVNNLNVENAMALTSGGAILADGGALTITNSRFWGNSGGFGGGIGGGAIHFTGAMTLTISGSTFDNNRTDGALGGGAVLAEGHVVIRNSTFSNNQVNFIGNGGGAVSAASANLTIEGSKFKHNYANRRGGALLADASMAAITNSTFTGNTAQLVGGVIHLASGRRYGEQHGARERCREFGWRPFPLGRHVQRQEQHHLGQRRPGQPELQRRHQWNGQRQQHG